jgi:hypothetical protein
LLLLISCAWAPVSQSPQLADASLFAAIIGCWTDQRAAQGVTVRGLTCYHPDGKAEMTAEAKGGGVQLAVKASGTWRIANKKLISTVTESSLPQMMAPGTTTTDDIISISADRMVIITEDGTKYISVKVEEPKGKQAPK